MIEVPHAKNPKGGTTPAGGREYSTMQKLTPVGTMSTGVIREPRQAGEKPTLAGQLFDSRAEFKIAFANIAMHLSSEWRSRLFVQIDELLDVGEWDPEDEPPGHGASRTLLRTMLFLRPQKRPGLGITHDGNLVAAWTSPKDDRLTLICYPGDIVRWVVSTVLDDVRETAAGSTTISRLKAVLEPYSPQRWLVDGGS